MYIYRRESAKYFSDSLLYILVITTLSKKNKWKITNVGKDYLVKNLDYLILLNT